MLTFRSVRRAGQLIAQSHSTSSSLNTVPIAQSSSSQCGEGTYTVGDATNIKWFEGAVPRRAKERLLGQRGCILWFTGLSGSGKSTVACTLEHALNKAGCATALLDGDNIRHGLNSNLGFSAADRAENIRRIGEVSRLFLQTGLITIVAFISPYRIDRQRVRERVPADAFIEIYMRVPLKLCEQRDPKGLYEAARAGKLKGFTGIDDPYEEPLNPELVVDAYTPAGQLRSPTHMAAQILQYMQQQHILKPPDVQLLERGREMSTQARSTQADEEKQSELLSNDAGTDTSRYIGTQA